MDYMTGDTVIEEFRDGIFALRTRRFGMIAEIMIKKLYDFDESGSLAFDKIDKNSNERIEVKFSTVMKENDDRNVNLLTPVIKGLFKKKDSLKELESAPQRARNSV